MKRRTEKLLRTADSRPEPTILLYPRDMCQSEGDYGCVTGSASVFRRRGEAGGDDVDDFSVRAAVDRIAV